MRIAKKALATAKTALRTANRADDRASQALDRTAELRVFVVDGPDVFAAPGDFGRAEVVCPAGTRATGFSIGLGALELVAALSTGDAYLASAYNPSSTTSYSYSVDVTCIGGTEGVAITSTAGIRRQLRKAEEAHLVARR
jgi:hypothetical protein